MIDEEDHVVQPLRFTKAHTEEDKKEEEGVEYSCLRVYFYSATPENLRRSSITTFSVRLGRLRILFFFFFLVIGSLRIHTSLPFAL